MKQCILLAMIDLAVSGWPSLNTNGFLFLHKQNLLMEKKYVIGSLLLNSVMFEGSFHFSEFTEVVFVPTAYWGMCCKLKNSGFLCNLTA